MKKIRVFTLIVALFVLLSAVPSAFVSAGIRETVTSLIVTEEDKKVLNDTDWNITDGNISQKGNTVVIPAKTATSSTKIIAKSTAKQCENVERLAIAETNLKITELKGGEQFVLALGLSSIEAGIGEAGNIELSFTNNNGIKVTARAVTESKTETLFSGKNCGLSLNRNFSVKMALTTSKTAEFFINNKSLGKYKLPVSGEGRFGILETGLCGAVISDCSYICYSYETPENTDVFEDFENGDFNANLFVSSSTDYGVYPSGIKIEDYNGSKVLRFENTRVAYFCTLHQYSNFEISFDVPYYNREYRYDEYGNLIGKPCSNMAIGFGEETCTPVGYAYTTDVDLVCFAPDVIRSEFQKTYRVPIADLNITDFNNNNGYSVKLTVVDGHYDVAVKSLSGKTFKTVASSDYKNQRSGYVNIWSTGCGDFAIDNLKITNLDKNPNKITVERKTSTLKSEDYVPMAEENEKKFRPVSADNEKSIFDSKFIVLDICLVGAAVVLCGAGAVYTVIKKKRAEKKQ